MLSESGKVGITVIWPPWSGKSALVKRLLRRISWWNILIDLDNNILESDLWLWKDGIANYIQKYWDLAFLEYENNLTQKHLGVDGEWKTFGLNQAFLSASWSLPKSPEAMKYIKERTFVILLHADIEDVLKNIEEREDGASRIVWMNGWPNGEEPMSANLREEIIKRNAAYQEAADAVFIITQTDTIEERAEEFEKFILQIIENSILHSA